MKAIIFDVDGTLYEPILELEKVLHEYWIKRIAEVKKLSLPEAETSFRQLKTQYKSSTRVLEVLGLGDPFKISRQAEKYLAPWIRKYVKRDRKTIQLIKKLRQKYSLYVLRNGTKAGTRLILQKLGFENRRPHHVKGFGPFDEIFPTTEFGVTKPHPLIFENALKILKLNPSEIVMVGDRVEVDLAPAKKIGMKTVLVSWGKEMPQSKDVDVTIESIYDMKELI